MAGEVEMPSCVRGYHIYHTTWSPVLVETLPCTREPTNSQDRYAVAVRKAGVTVGHVPRKISRLCSLFLRRGGEILCTVTGGHRYSSDLEQGGMEIPCLLLFKGKPRSSSH